MRGHECAPHPPRLSPQAVSVGLVSAGEIAAWVGAVGTVLAFFAALAVLAFDVRDRRRRQARLVSAFITQSRIRHEIGHNFPTDDGVTRRFGTHLAALPAPGTPVVLLAEAISFAWVVRNDSDEALGRIRAVLVNKEGSEAAVLLAKAYLQPGEVCASVEVSTVADAPSAPLSLRLYFEDGVGRCWQRQPGKPLRRLWVGRKAKLQGLGLDEAVNRTWAALDGSPNAFVVRRD